MPAFGKKGWGKERPTSDRQPGRARAGFQEELKIQNRRRNKDEFVIDEKNRHISFVLRRTATDK